MSKHTPGPWEYAEWGRRIISGTGNAEILVATVAINTYRDQGRHNANLIVAAPNLYEALKAMTDAFLDTQGSHGAQEQAAMEAARAALAKVDGS